MRYELSDTEWSTIRVMLPNKPRGVARVDDRRVLNGIFWVLRSGAPWRDLPGVYQLRAVIVSAPSNENIAATSTDDGPSTMDTAAVAQ
jgi:transposase